MPREQPQIQPRKGGDPGTFSPDDDEAQRADITRAPTLEAGDQDAEDIEQASDEQDEGDGGEEGQEEDDTAGLP